VESPSSRLLCSRHSIETGESRTRGGATTSLGSIAIPSSSASPASGGNGAELSLTACSSGACARFTTNSRVSCTLRSVSLAPTEVNCTIGGFAHATV